ncbi:MAG: hypothetical protein JXA81_01585 [Sedimentisphaerales bacterium]|nr:hypothetical protein [Sedimentisphaerales bacterium]
MNDLLLQMMLARRNNDVESWMNILFVVVLAIFWLVGGIIKAKANKSQTGSKDNLFRKPVRKPPLHSREAREQMLKRLERSADSVQNQQPRSATQKPRMKFSDLQAAVRKFAVEAEKAFHSDTREPVREIKPPLTDTQIKAEKLESTEPMTTTIKELQGKRASESAQIPESEYLSKLLTDYSDPDELRRAILHYEILGKPLSLRNPSDDSIGL